MKKKRAGIFISLALMAALLAGCESVVAEARASGAEKQAADFMDVPKTAAIGQRTDGDAVVPNGKLIYIITPSAEDLAVKAEADMAETEAKRLGYKTKAVSHDGDPAKQVDLINAAITEGASAIILDSAEASNGTDAVKIAMGAGIPTFCIGREGSAQSAAVAHVVSNHDQGAKLVGECFAEAMGEKGEYAELTGAASDANAVSRSDAFHEVLDPYTAMTMAAQESVSGGQQEAFEKTKIILQNHPNIKGIICGKDAMAIGAVTAIQAAGLEGKVIVAGYGGSDAARDQVITGNMICTCLEPFAECAKMAVQQADTYISTGVMESEEKQMIDCTLITPENAGKLSGMIVAE